MTPEQFGTVLEHMAAGSSARAAIAMEGISVGTFWRYLDADKAAAEQYAHARARGMDRVAEGALDIADDPDIDPNHKRIMVDTRKWFLSKLAPHRYGDKLDLAHTGANGGPIETSVRVLFGRD